MSHTVPLWEKRFSHSDFYFRWHLFLSNTRGRKQTGTACSLIRIVTPATTSYTIIMQRLLWADNWYWCLYMCLSRIRCKHRQDLYWCYIDVTSWCYIDKLEHNSNNFFFKQYRNTLNKYTFLSEVNTQTQQFLRNWNLAVGNGNHRRIYLKDKKWLNNMLNDIVVSRNNKVSRIKISASFHYHIESRLQKHITALHLSSATRSR